MKTTFRPSPRLQSRAPSRTAASRALLVLTLSLPAFANSANAGGVSVDELAGPVSAEQVSSSDAGTQWTAEVTDYAHIRSAPKDTAKTRTVTTSYARFSGRRAILLVTGAYREASGREWVRVLLPLRPNGTSGWLRRDAVRLISTPVKIRVHLGARRLDLWRGTTRIGSYPVGIGKRLTPTPTGRFAVDDKVETLPTDRAAYGRYILTVTAHSTVLKRFNGGVGQIAIHGSGTLGRVGVPSSHGCLILGNEALRMIWSQVGRGTPIEISAS